jgi:probable rRNA maturation factor
LSLRIYYDQINFRLKGWRKISEILSEVIRKEGKVSGDLTFVLTDDDTVRKINVQFLKHDYNTDVITFDYCEGDEVNGEIYISVDTVRENSINYNDSLKNEINRVLIHGVLHLVGYDDKSLKAKKKMTEMENFWLNQIG